MTECLADNCTRPRRSRGLCDRHYQLWRLYGRNSDVALPAQHAGNRTGNPHYNRPGSLVCVCDTPQPTPTDMCAACFRVIAELVIARRNT